MLRSRKKILKKPLLVTYGDMSILDKIILEKKIEVEKRKEKKSLFESIINAKKDRSPIIAEIKRRSPISPVSAGSRIIYIKETCKILADSGVSGISVLTDKNFDGSIDDLAEIKKLGLGIPLLRKDFIIDEFQIYESAVCGADAVLLIAHILREKVYNFMSLARKFDMECLVEVRGEEDIDFIYDARLVGINSRNLDTFDIDLSRIKISELIPCRDKRVVVAESGIKNRKDMDFVLNYADAALIGTSIMDNLSLLKELAEKK